MGDSRKWAAEQEEKENRAYNAAIKDSACVTFAGLYHRLDEELERQRLNRVESRAISDAMSELVNFFEERCQLGYSDAVKLIERINSTKHVAG